jgi:hypothetical protein
MITNSIILANSCRLARARLLWENLSAMPTECAAVRIWWVDAFLGSLGYKYFPPFRHFAFPQKVTPRLKDVEAANFFTIMVHNFPTADFRYCFFRET